MCVTPRMTIKPNLDVNLHNIKGTKRKIIHSQSPNLVPALLRQRESPAGGHLSCDVISGQVISARPYVTN